MVHFFSQQPTAPTFELGVRISACPRLSIHWIILSMIENVGLDAVLRMNDDCKERVCSCCVSTRSWQHSVVVIFLAVHYLLQASDMGMALLLVSTILCRTSTSALSLISSCRASDAVAFIRLSLSIFFTALQRKKAKLHKSSHCHHHANTHTYIYTGVIVFDQCHI